jgi:hypothetical protein
MTVPDISLSEILDRSLDLEAAKEVGKKDKRPFHRTSEYRLPSGSDNTPLG